MATSHWTVCPGQYGVVKLPERVVPSKVFVVELVVEVERGSAVGLAVVVAVGVGAERRSPTWVSW